MGKQASKRVQHGQAMVEFALTSLLFILVVVSIIELARIMHAYVTIQHAARIGGRYAVTGQWMPEFAGADPAAHYDAESGDPYARIYPCWPRFYDDPLPKAQTPRGTTYYEPYRGPRTCSIEKQVLQQMRPLALLPDAGFSEPGHYQVVVSSSSDDSTPTNGQFSRNGVTLDYADYYDNTNPTAELVRGYAGKPNGQVVIQIRYNVRLVTPILSSIVPYIPLQARVVMTNEAFGSTSVLTEAAPAPNLGPVNPLRQPIAADLMFVGSVAANTSANPDASITYNFTITNSGELNAINAFDVCLYASRSNNLGESDLRNPNTLASLNRLGCTQFSRLESGMSEAGSITAAGLDDEGFWYVYAVIDPETNTGDEIEGSIDERGTGPQYPEQEKNNWLLVEEVEVGKGVNLQMTLTTPSPSYTMGQTFDITLTISNIGSQREVTGLSVYMPVPTEYLTVTNSSSTYNGSYWTDVTIPAGGTVTLTLSVRVDAPAASPITIAADIQPGYMPQGYYDLDGVWPQVDEQVTLQSN